MIVTLTLEGMTCAHCVKAVTEALAALPGVSDVQVEIGRATYRSDRAPDEAALAAAMDEAGYELASVSVSGAP